MIYVGAFPPCEAWPRHFQKEKGGKMDQKHHATRKHPVTRNNPEVTKKKPKETTPLWLKVVRRIEKAHEKEIETQREKKGSQVKPKSK